MQRLRKQDRLTLVLKTVALCVFAGYLVWNAFWLWQGRVPDSIWRYVTGLPCATTGCTRSLMALWEGRYGEAFLFNPMLLVYVFLIVASAWSLGQQVLSGRRCVLPKVLAAGWLVALALGWVLKFVLGSAYW